MNSSRAGVLPESLFACSTFVCFTDTFFTALMTFQTAFLTFQKTKQSRENKIWTVICKQQSELQSPTAPQQQLPRVERHIPPQQIPAIAGDLICHRLLKRKYALQAARIINYSLLIKSFELSTSALHHTLNTQRFPSSLHRAKCVKRETQSQYPRIKVCSPPIALKIEATPAHSHAATCNDKHPYVPQRRTRADRAARRCPSRGGGRGSSCRPCTGWVPSRRSARSPCGTAGTSGHRCHQRTQRGMSSHTSWRGNQWHWALVPAPVTSCLRHCPCPLACSVWGVPQP